MLKSSEAGTTLIDKSAPVHRYHQVKEVIRQQVRQRKLQPGRRIGSVMELAKSFQVSKATIAKATAELIDEGVLYSEVGKGTYVADPRDKRTYTICFVVHSADYITAPYFSQMIAGMGAVTEQNHYKLQFLTSERAVGALGGGSPYPAVKDRKWADGLIVMDNSFADEQLRRLAENRPIIVIGRRIAGANIACVRTNNKDGTREAISYLAGLGHRRIGLIIMSRKWQTEKEKVLSYQSTVRRLSLDAEPGLIVNRGLGTEGTKSALDALLALPDRPTAILASGDGLAFEAIHLLREKGLKVPEDISVMGFTGCLTGMVAGLPLTTMQLPIVEMGRTAADMLLALINEEKIADKDMVFTPKLVVRQSCGPRRR
ncbi:MAG: GntR family transcriptional regulator [Planctomycetota bacterium]|nr:GntR family transcriptional regulator [Planctomycetota bacterium]